MRKLEMKSDKPIYVDNDSNNSLVLKTKERMAVSGTKIPIFY